MVSAEKMRHQIECLTADLITSGLCVDQNFPAMNTAGDGWISVGLSNTDGLAITLKNVSYKEIYTALREARIYNMRLIDGAMLQMMYRFCDNGIKSHRLAFFPSPDLLEYQNNSELYDEDELYADIVPRSVVTSPVRFDFDAGAYEDYHHPMSHLTIGQYKNCRIPVSGPVDPFSFTNFVLRSFYNTPFRKFCSEMREFEYEFERTISEHEQRHLHVIAAG